MKILELRLAKESIGQVTLEYFLLFTVVALVTLLGFTTFDESVRKTCEDFFNAMAADLTK